MIRFFTEDVDFELPHKQKVRKWLKALAEAENCTVGELNYIFCSDEYLLEVNRQYLDHDYYTDIITFDNSSSEDRTDGDVFVSVDRIHDNAQSLGVAFEVELRRVLAHGLLHLSGYGDKSAHEERIMRSKEDYYLQQYEGA